MKTLTSLTPYVSIIVIALVLIPVSCSEPTEAIITDSYGGIQGEDWISDFEKIFYGSGIIVQKGQSIQKALDVAEPGQTIYVEAGVYEEALSISKSNIRLVGLPNGAEEVIIKDPGGKSSNITVTPSGANVEIVNIRCDNDYSNQRPSSASRQQKPLVQITRAEISDDIAHYQLDIRVGHRPYDVIRLHRVVREHRPYHPAHTRGSVFMLHGASLKFESIFLRAGTSDNHVSSEVSSAAFLATRNIDVWGMDFAWTLVPEETTDFSFMEDWGVERDVDHTLAGLSVARLIRGLSRQGFGRMNVLGFSYGVGVAYGAANRETQHLRFLRSVGGIIAVDQVLKFAPDQESNRQLACNAAAAAKTPLDNGVFHSSGGLTFANFAALAINAPNDPSPFIPIPGITNFQAALFVGTSTYILRDPATPWWHFVSGTFDQSIIPNGLRYTTPDRWIGLLGSLPPYQPQRTTYEMRACVCDEEDVSIDDHFSEIEVPILYVGAGGAFGTFGYYTSALTASQDITNHTVTLLQEPTLDFGHGDLFLANNAPDLVWSLLYQWIIGHNSRGLM